MRSPDAKSFGHALDEFLDAFYLDHPNESQQQRRLDAAPNFTGNPLQDAWLGAVGEISPVAGGWTCRRGRDVRSTML